jgi:hypothetical protein
MVEPFFGFKFWSDLLSQGLAAMLGAVAGATIAFTYERRKSREEEARFADVVTLISQRSKIHPEEVQPAIESAGFIDSLSPAEAEKACGPRVTRTIDLVATVRSSEFIAIHAS